LELVVVVVLLLRLKLEHFMQLLLPSWQQVQQLDQLASLALA
tara:strand:- start:1073 stop:1198 length:126 start_codon:yes stop_codon:yes gene_type:complete